MHIPSRTLVAACAFAAVLLVVAGCDSGDRGQASNGSTGGELFLQPVADRGPDPFTASTDTSTASRPPVTRTPQSAPTGSPQVRTLSGATPGLYGGTRNAGSCDVEKQIRYLDADRAGARAFGEVSGIATASVPDYLRQLTPVVLRADTRVTNHGFGDGRATGFQAVLQAGTAVLVDNRGVPRVRCACGNPLGPPVVVDGNPGTRGRSWRGYRPAQVVMVTPAPDVITDITIVDVGDNTWIERPVGHDGHRHDHVVPPPDGPTPGPHDSASPHDPSSSASPGGRSPSPEASASDCVTPTATATTTPSPGTGRAPRARPPGPAPRPPERRPTGPPWTCPGRAGPRPGRPSLGLPHGHRHGSPDDRSADHPGPLGREHRPAHGHGRSRPDRLRGALRTGGPVGGAGHAHRGHRPGQPRPARRRRADPRRADRSGQCLRRLGRGPRQVNARSSGEPRTGLPRSRIIGQILAWWPHG